MLNFRVFVACCAVLAYPSVSSAGQVTFNGGADAEFSNQSVGDIDNNRTLESNNVVLTPFVSAIFDSRDIDFLVRASHSYVYRSLENENASNNFTNYNYSGQYQIIDNLLSVQVSGAQDFRAELANSFLVDNFLLNAENLRKTNTNFASVNFNLPTGNYIGANAQLSLGNSSVDADNANVGMGGFNNNIMGGRAQIVTGRDFRPFFINFVASTNVVDRDVVQDLESNSADLTLSFDAFSDISLRLLGFYEDNSFSSNDAEVNQEPATREFFRYGAAIAWSPALNRFIEIGINQSVSNSDSNPEDDEDTFLSLNMQWAFSSRTNLSAGYTRRFFGESASFSFSHNLRNFRSSVTYSETLTTNSQLIISQEDGLLICANGSQDLSDCRLTDDLNTELGAGDIAIRTNFNVADLNDNVIVRKVLSAQSAVDLRRTTIVGTLTRSTNEQQDARNNLLITTASLLGTLRASSRSTFTANLSYSDLERTGDTAQTSTVKRAELVYERDLSLRMSATLGLSYLDRKGGNLGGGNLAQGINGPLTERIIRLGVSYQLN